MSRAVCLFVCLTWLQGGCSPRTQPQPPEKKLQDDIADRRAKVIELYNNWNDVCITMRKQQEQIRDPIRKLSLAEARAVNKLSLAEVEKIRSNVPLGVDARLSAAVTTHKLAALEMFMMQDETFRTGQIDVAERDRKILACRRAEEAVFAIFNELATELGGIAVKKGNP